MTGLPFTEMGGMVDQAAIEACIASGLLVIVEIGADRYSIAGIVSAHCSITQARAAYRPLEDDNDYALIIPQQAGPAIFYSWLTIEEMREASRR